MKRIVISLLLSVGLSFADGLPLNSTGDGIDAEHVFLDMTGSQLEEIVAFGTFTLTEDQWAKARKMNAACPKRISTVYPKDWNDCTCGSENEAYAIQWDGKRVAIVFSSLPEDPTASLRYALAHNGHLTLGMDSRGQFYFDGVLIPYGGLLKAVEVKAAPNPNEVDPAPPTVFISLPLGYTAESEALKSRITGLRGKLEFYGWHVLVR